MSNVTISGRDCAQYHPKWKPFTYAISVCHRIEYWWAIVDVLEQALYTRNLQVLDASYNDVKISAYHISQWRCALISSSDSKLVKIDHLPIKFLSNLEVSCPVSSSDDTKMVYVTSRRATGDGKIHFGIYSKICICYLQN